MKINNTLKLVIVLALLGGAYFGVNWYNQSKNQSDAFRKPLVEFDKEAVDKLVINQGPDQAVLIKQDNRWYADLENGKKTEAVDNKVTGLLDNLLTIRQERLVTQKADKHAEYQLTDSAAKRIAVYSDGKVVTDLLIGKFEMVDQRTAMTYLRRADADEVFAKEGFLPMSFSPDPSNYRKQAMLAFSTDSVAQIAVSLPGDSSYVLRKVQTEAPEPSARKTLWMIDEQMADSAAVATYLRDLSRLRSSDFVNDVAPESLSQPTHKVVVQLNDGGTQELAAFAHPQYDFVLQSSHNPEGLFEPGLNNLMPKAFKAPSDLLTGQAAQP